MLYYSYIINLIIHQVACQMIFSICLKPKKNGNAQSQSYLTYRKKNNHITSQKLRDNPQPDSYNRLDWIRRKYKQFEELNQLSPVNSSKDLKQRNKSHNHIFQKNKNTLEHINQSIKNATKQKRLLTQSQIFEKKKRKSNTYSFFNKTLVDKQHNFIGRNYFKQIQNLKFNSLTATFSPQKNDSEDKFNQNYKQSQKIFSILNQRIERVSVMKQFLPIKEQYKAYQHYQQLQIAGFRQGQKSKIQNRYQIDLMDEKLKKYGVRRSNNAEISSDNQVETDIIQKISCSKKYKNGSKLSKFLKIKQKKQMVKIQKFAIQSVQQYKYSFQQQNKNRNNLNINFSCQTSPQKIISRQIQMMKDKKNSFSMKLNKLKKNSQKQQFIQKELILLNKRKYCLKKIKDTQKRLVQQVNKIQPWQYDQPQFVEL